MDAFPHDYVVHNLPLIVLSGLGIDDDLLKQPSERSGALSHEGGFRIRTDLPTLTDHVAEDLLKEFLASDATHSPWISRAASTKYHAGTYRIIRVGRVGQAPCGIPTKPEFFSTIRPPRWGGTWLRNANGMSSPTLYLRAKPRPHRTHPGYYPRTTREVLLCH